MQGQQPKTRKKRASLIERAALSVAAPAGKAPVNTSLPRAPVLAPTAPTGPPQAVKKKRVSMMERAALAVAAPAGKQNPPAGWGGQRPSSTQQPPPASEPAVAGKKEKKKKRPSLAVRAAAVVGNALLSVGQHPLARAPPAQGRSGSGALAPQAALKEGFLYKKGTGSLDHSWRQRWCQFSSGSCELRFCARPLDPDSRKSALAVAAAALSSPSPKNPPPDACLEEGLALVRRSNTRCCPLPPPSPLQQSPAAGAIAVAAALPLPLPLSLPLPWVVGRGLRCLITAWVYSET